jgi:hypothetical protein
MERGSFEATLRTALTSHPEVFDAFSTAHAAAWSTVEADLLTLCDARIALLLGTEHAEPLASPKDLSAAQQACVNFADQFVIDVASMDDRTVAAVADALGADGLLNFVNALLVLEQRQRLQLLWGRLLPEVAA